jgi:siroheme synthase-like protein
VALAFSPAFLEALAAFDAERHERSFRPEDLDGIHLVISATSDPAANAVIAAHARARGLWVNAVDDAASCDALFPSILRRGPFVAALSTEGAFAGLSRVVREALEGLVPDATVPEFEALIQLRRQLRQSLLDPAERAERLRSLLRQVRQEALPAEAAR